MATLNGQAIDATYQSLLKTTDNSAVSATSKTVSDGTGNEVPMNVSTTEIGFTGNVNFTGATVIGLDGAGLVAGTGTNSMKSADSLTSIAPISDNIGTIAIGNGAKARQEGSIGISTLANASGAKAIAIGQEATASGSNSTCIGWNSFATGSQSVAIGTSITAAKDNTVTIKALETLTPSTPTDGGIIMTDAGSTQRRININDSGIINIDAEAYGANLQYYPWDAVVSGYGSTYARSTQPMVGGPFWGAAVDQNANTAILSKANFVPGETVTAFVNPFLSVVADDTYELAIYDCHPNGAPKDKVFTTSVSVIGASGDQYVETTVSFTPKENRYWIAMQTPDAGDSKIGMMSRDSMVNNYFTYGAWGASPVGILAINSLYYNGGSLPSSFLISQSFGHRDECLVALYKC